MLSLISLEKLTILIEHGVFQVKPVNDSSLYFVELCLRPYQVKMQWEYFAKKVNSNSVSIFFQVFRLIYFTMTVLVLRM